MKIKCDYCENYIDTTSESWNNVDVFAKDVIENFHINNRFEPNYIFPEWVSVSQQQLLRQIVLLLRLLT